MDSTDLENRFRHHPPTSEGRAGAHNHVRSSCFSLAEELNDVLPEGREKALVMTKLEEVMFWSNAALARQG